MGLMRIAKQAWTFVGLGAAAAAGGAGLVAWGRGAGGAWAAAAGLLLLVLGLGFSAFCLYFFRDPDRPMPADPSKIYSPGDGVVLSAVREGDRDGVTLRIFLSVFDVHLQRAPCAGRVESVQHVPGSFKMAMKDAAKANERVSMRLKPAGSRPALVVEQIAGLVARRIECWSRPGDELLAGERYGIIHFGSQAAVHFPPAARCVVKPGDRVVGGVTAVGEWTS